MMNLKYWKPKHGDIILFVDNEFYELVKTDIDEMYAKDVSEHGGLFYFLQSHIEKVTAAFRNRTLDQIREKHPEYFI